MLVTYWSAKGGAGASVLAAAHAMAGAGPTLLVDCAGDLPDLLGLDGAARQPGITDWLAAGHDVPTDALDRLLVRVDDRVDLLCRGTAPVVATEAVVARAAVLAEVLSSGPRTVVADAGTSPAGAAAALCRAADRSVLVTRACYLAIQRATRTPLAATEVALVREPQRALRRADVEAALGLPVRIEVPVDPGIARAVDAGLLASRLPRALRRASSRDRAAA